MKDVIKTNGWTSIRSNSSKTYFYAVDRPFSGHTMELEVITGEKVLVNGQMFSKTVVPTIEEAKTFCSE